MDTLLELLWMLALILMVVVLIACAGAGVFLAWVASGSPDVNGDPERDAGYTNEEIRAMTAARAGNAARGHEDLAFPTQPLRR